MRFRGLGLGRACAALSFVLLFAMALPSAARAEGKRHHITVGLGFQRFMSSDFDGSDFKSAGMGAFAYRISANKSLDLVLDSRATVSTTSGLIDVGGTIYNADANYSTSWVGPGVRYTGSGESARPYVQANLYFAQETLEVTVSNVKVSNDESGVGFGLQGGVDIRLSRLLSLPIEANLLIADPADNLTSLGIGAGITFNFGQMP